MLWKSERATRIRDYSCNVCIKKRMYKNRICYLFPKLNKRKGDPYIPVPLLDIDGKQITESSGKPAYSLRQLSRDELFEVLWSIQNILPDIPAYKLHNIFFRKVCPEGYMDDVVSRILESESESASYNINISDDDIRREVLGFDMSLSDLLEAYNIVKSTRNAYEKFMMEEMEARAKQRS